MKARPILFSGPMVRALLAGTKTQTRRLVKMKPHQQIEQRDDGSNWPRMFNDGDGADDYWLPCPYGISGDRLWVREDFRFPQSLDGLSPAEIGKKCLGAGYSKPWCPTEFKADRRQTGNWIGFETPPNTATPGRRRASMHMPRWASRILLEIVSVRVERLNDISKDDALSEGVSVHTDHHTKTDDSIYSPVQAYRDLWQSINGAGSWAKNPWVWVVEFKRVEA